MSLSDLSIFISSLGEDSVINFSVASPLFLVKYTNTVSEKSSVNETAYLSPFESAGSVGPARSVWTNCNMDVAHVSGCLFQHWENFSLIQISQSLLLVPLPLIFIPSTTSGNLTILS